MNTETSPRKRRVVVTGMGAVTPLGLDLDSTWKGILAGRLATGPIRRFDASGFPTRIACEVSEIPGGFDGPEPLSFSGRFGLAAAMEARSQARLADFAGDPARLAVCLGVGMECPPFEWFDQVYLEGRLDDPSVKDHIRLLPYRATAAVARLVRAGGSVTTIHTACASSGNAVGEAYELVAHDRADIVVTGGMDSMINPFHVAGFSLLGALSRRNDAPGAASRPFDRERDGFVLGEGAAVLVLEELDHALRRGAPILGEVLGYGVSTSAYRVTDLHPSGRGPVEAMQMALAEAELPASAIGYVNAHGTSTLLNDRIEALAINRVFGRDEHQPFTSSTKSMTGHMISAAGALELALCVKVVAEQILPPSINLNELDPDCGIRPTPPQATPSRVAYALSNSVGFGGSNTALIAGRIEP